MFSTAAAAQLSNLLAPSALRSPLFTLLRREPSSPGSNKKRAASEAAYFWPLRLTFVDEDLDLAEAEVLLVLAVVPQVDELPAVALVLVAVEQRLLVLKLEGVSVHTRTEYL